ncbi:MAG: flagellar biosynthesis protein FlhB [Rhodospirillaceae bacterium]|nr:flagellar biosynthesis protein FlhB [Rhodospirillaceae bacterium]
MSEDQDQSSKTEEPSPRKLEEARRKGQVVTSQEVKHWFALMGGLLAVIAFLPLSLTGISQGLATFLANVHRVPTDPGSLIDLLQSAVGDLLLFLILPLAALVAAALAGGFIQHGFVASAESLKPKLSKISPLSGAKRLFSLKSLMEFIKGLLKLAIVGAVAAVVIWPEINRVELFTGMAPEQILHEVWEMVAILMVAVVCVVGVIAAADYLYQRWEFMKQQRMTKQEVKDEYKQTEGDPMVKARLRQIRMERARRRMMQAVPTADVVITNPTHFAVALAYKPEEMSAPMVVAKGADNLARRIRELAEEHDVSIVENPPLARALYQSVEVDEEIPAAHYRAVAEVISYVFRLKRRPMPQSRRRAPAGPGEPPR